MICSFIQWKFYSADKAFYKQGQHDHIGSAKNSEMSFLSNSRLQNRKKHPNRFTNNGDMAETTKRYIVYE